ncbi:unnamed protein product, partial [Calicophoron daubneyi]
TDFPISHVVQIHPNVLELCSTPDLAVNSRQCTLYAVNPQGANRIASVPSVYPPNTDGLLFKFVDGHFLAAYSSEGGYAPLLQMRTALSAHSTNGERKNWTLSGGRKSS